MSPPEMVPSPDSPPILIVTSFSIECSLEKMCDRASVQHVERPRYGGCCRPSDGTGAHLMISCKNSHVSMPSFGLCSWASFMAHTVVFLSKTGGTELNVLHPS